MIENSVMIANEDEETVVNTFLKQFKRKFVILRDDDTGLNLQLEICINPKGKLLVRHYTLYIVYNFNFEVINSKEDNFVDKALSNIYAKCRLLYKFSIKWLGYNLKCENIILIDEKKIFK